MKKLFMLILVLVVLVSCKKECTCTKYEETSKTNYVQGEYVTTWKITDTVSVTSDCTENGEIEYITPTLRHRIDCN